MSFTILTVKIYNLSPIQTNADLLLSTGVVETINWNTTAERVMALKHVTANTRFIDLRA